MSEYAYLNGLPQLPDEYVRQMARGKELHSEHQENATSIIYDIICPQINQARIAADKLHWGEHGPGKLYRLIERLNFRRMVKKHDQ